MLPRFFSNTRIRHQYRCQQLVSGVNFFRINPLPGSVRPPSIPSILQCENTLNIRKFSQSMIKLKDTVTVNFIDKDNKKITVEAKEGQNILDIAHENDIDLEGACEASLACSTCHVIVDQQYYDQLPEPEEQEEDMLDLAYGLTPHSRLGCQVIVDKSLEGITVSLPKNTRNMLMEEKVIKDDNDK